MAQVRVVGTRSTPRRRHGGSGTSSARELRRHGSRSCSPHPQVQHAVDLLLQGFGSGAAGSTPHLIIVVVGHEEIDGHTQYHIRCTLCNAKPDTTPPSVWGCWRRLRELRDLHDIVKQTLGETYSSVFGETPFARHGGFPGTTARLHAWLGTLASCINSGRFSSEGCSQALRMLGAPGEEALNPHDRLAEQAEQRRHRLSLVNLKSPGSIGCLSSDLPPAMAA